MRRFARLYAALDGTTQTSRKVAAMAAYFAEAPPEDAAWALFFLVGRRLERLVTMPSLSRWGREASGTPEWLFDEAHAAVGDLAETLALLVRSPTDAEATALPLARWVRERLVPLRGLDEAMQRRLVLAYWEELPPPERFVLNKLLTGALRVGVSHTLVVRALAEVARLPPAVVAHRLMGPWVPDAALLARLLAAETRADDASRPYPFFLASPLERDPEAALGPRAQWQAEWKWDGIRAQLVRRGGRVWLWSRGEELVTERFPELAGAAAALPDGTVLDGEVLAWRGEAPLPFARLQRRIQRKDPGADVLEAAPVAFVAYDLLEDAGDDARARPLHARRARLEAVLAGAGPALRVSPIVEAPTWEALAAVREEARARGVEGLMLKRRDAPYGAGRRRGDWWKWKVAPFTLDAVLVHAMPGSGKRSSLYTDYTFALRDGEALVPFAKAYSGLDDAEISRLDAWVRRHTVAKHGPSRQVEPVHVFEVAFEGIRASKRHRSGVAVRFPRILRWRHDKRPEDADTIEAARALLAAHGT